MSYFDDDEIGKGLYDAVHIFLWIVVSILLVHAILYYGAW